MSETVLIGIPAGDGWLRSSLLPWVLSLISRGDSRGRVFGFARADGRPGWEFAVNDLVGQFLLSQADRLWIIDADMTMYRHSLGLLDHPGDIVCGRAFWASVEQGELRMVSTLLNRLPDGEYRDAELETFGPIDGGGTGCMILSRRVLEDRRLWLPTIYTAIDGTQKDFSADSDFLRFPPIFRTLRKPSGQVITTGDLDFCQRAKALGYSVFGSAVEGGGQMIEVNADLIHTTIKRVFQRGIQLGRGEAKSENVA